VSPPRRVALLLIGLVPSVLAGHPARTAAARASGERPSFASRPRAVAGGDDSVTHPSDAQYRAALGLVYDGAFAAAAERLAALAEEDPLDPVGPYLHALALEWRLEQDRARRDLDAEVLRLADVALARAAARLGHEPGDGRALLARGAAHGVKSRLHLFRRQKAEAARESVRMRESLLAARDGGVLVSDLDFGLGLYDYYADTLPRLFRLVRFFAGIPGGDRERGLDAIARAARGGTLFHGTEARVQMFEIQSYFEDDPDGALHWIREMRREYPGWPLWGLKLSELLRERLGLFDESASVAREILETAEEGRHVNYQPVVAAMARVALGEALLDDGRPAAAREAAAPAEPGCEEAGWVGPRASLVVGRSLDLEGEREAAVDHYRRAAAGEDARAAERARAALAHPPSAAERRAARLLAEAARLREAGRVEEARASCLEALRARPADAEARVCVAEDRIEKGDADAARALVRGVATSDEEPAWILSRARLVLARALEQRGDGESALRLYNQLWQAPLGRPSVREAAAAGIRRLSPATELPDAPRWER